MNIINDDIDYMLEAIEQLIKDNEILAVPLSRIRYTLKNLKSKVKNLKEENVDLIRFTTSAPDPTTLSMNIENLIDTPSLISCYSHGLTLSEIKSKEDKP